MDNERIIQLLNQVERNAGALYVRECIDGEWRNVPLLELPTHLAIKHTCKIVRTRLEAEGRPTAFAEDVRLVEEMFARRIVSLISEGNTKDTFEADVVDVTKILSEFAAIQVPGR